MAVSLMLWQPCMEELLFRGVLQGLFRETAWGRTSWRGFSSANVVCACLFAMAHLVYQPVLWALATFAPGLIFGYFRDQANSLWPALLLHCVFNAAFAHLLYESKILTADDLFPIGASRWAVNVIH